MTAGKESLCEARYHTVEQALRDSGSPVSGPYDGGLHPVAKEALYELDRIHHEHETLRLALETIRTSRNVPSDSWKHYARTVLAACGG